MTTSNAHPEDVKCAVRKTGLSLAELARRNGLSAVSGRNCLYYAIPSANRAIADHLGVPVHSLWPEWFREDGSRITRGVRQPSTTAVPQQRKKSRIA